MLTGGPAALQRMHSTLKYLLDRSTPSEFGSSVLGTVEATALRGISL